MSCGNREAERIFDSGFGKRVLCDQEVTVCGDIEEGRAFRKLSQRANAEPARCSAGRNSCERRHPARLCEDCLCQALESISRGEWDAADGQNR